MQVQSYRHHLTALESRNRFPLFPKILLVFLSIGLILVGIVSGLVYYENKKEAPIRNQAKYLEGANNLLSSSSQSISEILSSYEAASSKVKIVDNLKESSKAAEGYFVSLDDLLKSLSKIELLQKNTKNQIEMLNRNNSPQQYSDLNSRMVAYLEQAQTTLDQIYVEQTFIKDVLYASGPSFYLPTLTDETIWKEGNKNAIINYYNDTKTQADVTLKGLSRLEVPQVFKSYYNTQIAYLTLLVNVSDKIINTLSGDDDPNRDNATQTEKAYQQLTVARKDNEKLSDTLFEEKKKVFGAGENSKRFAQIKLMQNSLMENVQAELSSLPPTKLDKIPFPIISSLSN